METDERVLEQLHSNESISEDQSCYQSWSVQEFVCFFVPFSLFIFVFFFRILVFLLLFLFEINSGTSYRTT